MNWTQFLLGLSAVYVFYYLANVLFDFFRQGRSLDLGSESISLDFQDTYQPQLVSSGDASNNAIPEKPGVISSGPLQSTGGVNLKELFTLAQNDLIQFTGAIPY